MKRILLGLFASFLLSTLTGVAPAYAVTSVPYGVAALNGCYGFIGTSVDSDTNRAQMGTFCFDGAGNLVSAGTGLSGSCENTAGAITCGPTKGKYTLNNFAGDGTGVITLSGPCHVQHAFSINNASSGVAMGFTFIKVSPPCTTPDVVVEEGTAYFQHP